MNYPSFQQCQDYLASLKAMFPNAKWENYGYCFQSEQEIRRNNIWIKCQYIHADSGLICKAETGVAGWRIAHAEGCNPVEAVYRVIKRQQQLFRDVDEVFGAEVLVGSNGHEKR